MKLFQLIQKSLAFLGIDSIQSKCSQRKFVMTWLIYGLAFISSVLFLVFKANTFEQYTNNIYLISANSMICFDFLVIALKKEKLFKLIIDLEKFIDKSE